MIHSGKNFKVHEFERICEYAEEDGKRLPRRDEILVGGIVGVVDFYKVVEESDNIWFGGPYGWVFRKIRSTPFLPMKGQLKIFNVNPPARWRKDVGL